ncbi:dephospho-CoA kinase [Psychrobacillus psychrotolerans]|uniref:Dephospho-CoA kinase n=1 Tax=Psychrobacillus psychrotolerans TaxID=126156 RepID=A0A1I5YQE1_9BACI|nr:dephospho-CoA kinase [Psychrobacillus psychrotolerans]SFQ46433.1 dephospho-CoA kinase [Psychrobacillus psychrotolerans]
MIIGLTGSIASGKSTVANMLSEMGFPIIDADLVARIVVEKGTATLETIKEVFGTQVIHEDGTLNREELGALIFSDPSKRKQLNDIMHPAIREEMLVQRQQLVQQGHPVIIMDIPLLFESRLQSFVDKILVVTVTEQKQLERLMARNGFTHEEARLRIQSQLPLSVKEEGADAVIYNNETIEETKQQLQKVLAIWEQTN